MTNEDAIKIIGQYDVSGFEFYTTDGERIPDIQVTDAFEMALDALRKQIPMKPGHYEMDMDGRVVIPCGNCGSDLDGTEEHCKWCGQKIKWV